ncbi:MAG: ribosomal protein [Deltaproteobacteria bacterium]|jgi:large subunit ribosomal protein L35|nr:ribosomal protein [Deltaproteobacteria bacterium]
MPKLKTHRGLAKRVKLTARGKVKRARAFHSHLLSSKSPKRKRNLAKATLVHSTQEKTMKGLVPYL